MGGIPDSNRQPSGPQPDALAIELIPPRLNSEFRIQNYELSIPRSYTNVQLLTKEDVDNFIAYSFFEKILVKTTPVINPPTCAQKALYEQTNIQA